MLDSVATGNLWAIKSVPSGALEVLAQGTPVAMFTKDTGSGSVRLNIHGENLGASEIRLDGVSTTSNWILRNDSTGIFQANINGGAPLLQMNPDGSTILGNSAISGAPFVLSMRHGGYQANISMDSSVVPLTTFSHSTATGAFKFEQSVLLPNAVALQGENTLGAAVNLIAYNAANRVEVGVVGASMTLVSADIVPAGANIPLYVTPAGLITTTP